MTVKSFAKTLATYDYVVDAKDNLVRPISEKDKRHAALLASLPQFNFGFLPHDRLSRSRDWERRKSALAHMVLESEPPVPPIQNSINNAIGIARQQAIRASNTGQFSVNTIYADFVRQIAEVPWTASEHVTEHDRERLLQRLTAQANTTREYTKFGLMSELKVSGLLNTLRTFPPDRLHIVTQALEPFLRGNDARVEALKPLHIALTTMVETINAL
jgi:hypothetical protein